VNKVRFNFSIRARSILTK